MTKIAAQPLGGAPRPAPGDSLRGTGPPKSPDAMTERLLCWCCAQWGLETDAIEVIIYLGYDWTEPHRVEAARKHWAPWNVQCPLTEPPYLWKAQILDGWRKRGIEPPGLYGLGYSHANCGGCCVRGGQAQWALTLRVNRPRYLEWEAEEERSRAELGACGCDMTGAAS